MSKREKMPKTIIIAILCVVVIVSVGIIALVISLFQGTNAEPSYTFSDRTLIISGQFGKTIDLAGAKVEYISDGVPVTNIRTNGAALGNIEKGTFKLESIKVYKNIMDNTSQTYILITDNNGNEYYINSLKPQETEKLYNNIMSHK